MLCSGCSCFVLGTFWLFFRIFFRQQGIYFYLNERSAYYTACFCCRKRSVCTFRRSNGKYSGRNKKLVVVFSDEECFCSARRRNVRLYAYRFNRRKNIVHWDYYK